MNFMPESMAAATARRRDRTEHQILFSPFTMLDATSSSYSGGCMLVDEEEDMANCLIMLAHSTVSSLKSDLHNQKKTQKIKNRRLTEINAGEKSKSGFHIYECKTCNRSFPSFQALGGHSASHKKLKLTIEDRSSVSVIKTEFLEQHQPEENKIVTIRQCKNGKGKVHECSICGLEFVSGQALGGHMRRHRTVPASSNQIVDVSTNMDDRSVHQVIEKSPVLSLDLNLPAPEVIDDDVHSSNFQFAASSSQQSLVFPANALVDCHY